MSIRSVDAYAVPMVMWVGALQFDLLLGDVHSLKEKRSLVRPLIAISSPTAPRSSCCQHAGRSDLPMIEFQDWLCRSRSPAAYGSPRSTSMTLRLGASRAAS